MTDAVVYDDVRARRNAIILAIAQGIYGTITIMVVATIGLVGAQLAPDVSWATLPSAFWEIGTALTTLPLSLAMKHIGRRNGFLIGAVCGAASASVALVAIYQGSFALYLAGILLMGVYQASSSYYRFAAADHASPALRPKAISWVMTGGVVAAVFGTMLVMKSADLLAPVTFAGTYAVMVVLALAGIVVLLFLRSQGTSEDAVAGGPARPISEIVSQPRYIVAAALGMLSFGIMVLVMTATPLAMLGCGFSVQDSSWVIQWHVLAMFVPSFFTGNLIARFGVEKIAAFGMLLLVGAAVAGLLGINFANFALNLILLGLGWNFSYIGGTTMLTSTYRPSERNKAQGVNDFLVFVTVTITSLGAGKLLAGWGWDSVNYAVFPMVAVGLGLVIWLMTRPRQPAVA